MEKRDDEEGGDMISIVLTTFQRPSRLQKAIDSILKQTYPDWELIVVDDASKDKTEEVVKSFKDDRIKYIQRKKNFGTDTKPKNEGIMASKGEFIALLDDDNTYRPDHLAVLVAEMKKEPRWDVVYGDRWLTDETNQIQPQLGISLDFDHATLMQRNFIDTSDVLIKRQALFDVGGFDERYKKYIDWNLWVRLDKYGKHFKRAPVIITDYHLHSDMKSNRVKTKGDNPLKFVPDWDPYDLEIELPYLGTEPGVPRIAVFSLTYNRLAYTKKSFASLHKTAGYPFIHFVVDNGSTDGTVEWLKKNCEHVIFNKENYGISKASNQAVDAIKKEGFDIIVKFDNDCICLTEGWLAKMVEIWKSNHKMALSCYVQGLVDNPGGAPRVGYGTIKGELIGVTQHLGGICHFVDIHAYDEWKWDDNSFLHGIQDMEFSQWLRFHEYSQGYLENFIVSHGVGGTEQQKKDYPLYFEARVKEKQTKYEGNR